MGKEHVETSRTLEFNAGQYWLMREIHRVDMGLLWILQAIASTAVRRGELVLNDLQNGEKLQLLLNVHAQRLSEIFPELFAARELAAETVGFTRHRDGHKKRRVYETSKLPLGGVARFVEAQLLAWFADVCQETIEAAEATKQAEIIMVVGHQGVGKSTAVSFFEQLGYTVVSMSQIVRQVVAAWGLNETGTMDKIVVGQVFKENFGEDILVYLGVEHLLAQGQRKIVIDGPKVVGEALAVLAMGGRLVGVIADVDSQIDMAVRRDRIVQRASQQPTRKNDVLNFDKREDSESHRIQAILAMVVPKLVFRNNREGELLSGLTKEFLSDAE